MTTPVTLVSAYFNIGRESFKAVPRSEERYFREFSFWARIQNPLIIFVEPRCADQVREIREGFGLGHLTTIIEISDIFGIEPGIYERMRSTASCPHFRDFRLMPEATSGIPEYSYLMLLKSWFLNQAVDTAGANGPLCWIDFSFNRGGKVYSRPEDFNFQWTTEPFDKVVHFIMSEYDDRPVFELVRRLSDCIMGTLYVLPSDLANFLWESNRKQMVTLLDVGLIDDDQLIQMMSVRDSPEMFELRRSNWIRPLGELTGRDFTLAERVERGHLLSVARNAVHWSRRQRRASANAWKLYRNLVRDPE